MGSLEEIMWIYLDNFNVILKIFARVISITHLF